MKIDDDIVNKIDKPVQRKIVRYNPNIQNIGIAIIEIIAAELKSYSLIKFISSNLKRNASQVEITHKDKSVIIAIDRFE